MSSIPIFPEPAPRRAGFTLIEVLVALVISGFLVGVIFQLLQGNSRFVQMQSAREEVQQNGRAALDLIAGDLRMVSPNGIIAMERTAVHFYLPRGWGVLCNEITSSNTTAWVTFSTELFSADFVANAPHWGIAVEQTTSPAASTGQWRFVSNVGVTTSGSPCQTTLKLSPSTARVDRGFTTSVSPAFASSGLTIRPGTQVLLFEEMRYDVSPTAGTSVPGRWLRRMVGKTTVGPNMQPMAGPVPADSALRFTYLKSDGTPAASASQVRRIRVEVITRSRAEMVVDGTRRPQQMDTVSTEVLLRN